MRGLDLFPHVKSLKILQNIIQKSCVPAAYDFKTFEAKYKLEHCDVEKFLRSEAAYTNFYVRKRLVFTQLLVLPHDLNENWRMEVA